MRAARREKDFDIAVELLSDAPQPLAWGNLGDWSAATSYDDACRALALRVGTEAALQPDDRVLDLACGHGASLTLWPEIFGVRRVTGLEYRSRCVERIRQHLPVGLEAITHGRFDTLPAPAELDAPAFDAVVCVDAAYHATSLDAFAEFAAHLLKQSGRLAFTTLVAPSTSGLAWPLRRSLEQAGIASASVLPATKLITTLAAAGFTGIRLQRLDDAVLSGFHAFVQRRRQVLAWQRRASVDWLRIEATAWLCRLAQTRKALHYDLITATRSPAPGNSDSAP